MFFGDLKIDDPKLFVLGKPMLTKWYNIDEKILIKTRVGILYHSQLTKHSKD